MHGSVKEVKLLRWLGIGVRVVRLIDYEFGEALQAQTVVLTFEANVAVTVEDDFAVVAEKVGLKLREILPEHVAGDYELFVLLVSFNVGREALDERFSVEGFDRVGGGCIGAVGS